MDAQRCYNRGPMGTAPVQSRTSAADRTPERDALDRVLRSEVLDRAPNLVRLLRFVCEMYLAGRPEEIKEYNIGVQALGRTPEFDQKRDSIVRVEAHRLRKRLATYYRTTGAADPVEIVIRAGTYVPQFRPRDAAALRANEAPAESQRVPEVPPVRRPWRLSAAHLAVLAVLVVTVLVILASRAGKPAADSSRSAGMPAAPHAVPSAAAGTSIRIMAGAARDGFPDHLGRLWAKDQFFTGGDVVTAPPRPIQRTLDETMYLTRREGEFEYRIPAPPGRYELRLHFAETVFGEGNVAGGGESSRVFHVRVNGGELWLADIISEAAGANTATVRVYRDVQPGADGTVRIEFIPVRKEAPFINAIELIPSPNGKTQPARIVASAASVSVGGQEWGADRYWLGGMAVQRHESVQGPEDPALYQGERYGNFSYAVPVAPTAKYTVTLRFAESWFGAGRPGGGGEGNRVFNVYCNGQALLRNFDVFKTAGGSLRQVKKVFRGLQPNAQGKLNLEFVPVRNYGLINSIEVTEDPS
jgi:hypothetical protein